MKEKFAPASFAAKPQIQAIHCPNIVLIGMPAAGKSSIGKRLARRLNLNFIDTDDVLKQRTGAAFLGEIQQHFGSAGYQREEEKAICSLRVNSTVIATGGSAVFSKKAMRHLQKNGLIISIQVSYHQVQKRVGDLEKRGVLLESENDLQREYERRFNLYRRYADILFQPYRMNPVKSAEILSGLVRLLYGPLI